MKRGRAPRRPRTHPAAPGTRQPVRRVWPGHIRGFLAVFAIALVVRLAMVSQFLDHPLFRVPVLDSRQYLVWAQWILDGRWDWPQPWPQGPGYPLLLAGLLASGGSSLAFVAVTQSILGALSSVVTAAIGTRWFGTNAGVAAGVLQGLYGPLALVETSVLVEGPFLLTISAFVLWVTRGPMAGRHVFVGGVLIGTAALIRGTALPLAVVFAFVLWRTGRTSLPPTTRVILFIAGVLIVTVPAAAINASQGGGWRLQGKAGLNFWIGNTIEGDGLASFRPGRGWDRAESAVDRAGVLDVSRHDGYYFSKTFGEIAQEPARWVAILGRKAVWSFQREEVRDTLSFHYFARDAPWIAWLPGFGAILPLATVGFLGTLRDRRIPPELATWVAVTWLTLLLFVVGWRYRLPLVPPMAILAGVGLVSMLDVVRQRRWRGAAALAAAVLVTSVAARVWTHAPSRVFAEELTHVGDALQVERRFAEAEAKYREALAVDPHSAFALSRLGARFYNAGDLEQARTAQLQAVALEPMYADAWTRLAWIEGRLHRYDSAASYMRRAVEIYPRDVALRRYLARYLFEAGQFVAAADEFVRVVASNPGDSESARLLETARQRAR